MAVVAFIGLGQMGRPMSLNILRGGHSVQVFDVDRQALEALAAAGAGACPTPAEAARGAESPQIIALSTCSSEYTDARTIVLAYMTPYTTETQVGG